MAFSVDVLFVLNSSKPAPFPSMAGFSLPPSQIQKLEVHKHIEDLPRTLVRPVTLQWGPVCLILKSSLMDPFEKELSPWKN